MDVLVERCAGLDVHKRQVTACVGTPDGKGGRAQRVRTFPTFTDGLVYRDTSFEDGRDMFGEARVG